MKQLEAIRRAKRVQVNCGAYAFLPEDEFLALTKDTGLWPGERVPTYRAGMQCMSPSELSELIAAAELIVAHDVATTIQDSI